MRKFLATLTTISTFAALPWLCLAADGPLPKGGAVLDQFLEATGGKAAYQKIHSEVSTGSFELTGKGIRGSVTSFKAAPNKIYLTIDLAGIGKMEDGSNGEIAWNRSALQGPRIKDGDEKAAALREATFNEPLHWRKLYKSAETVGIEKVDDKDCYKVILTPLEGKPETQFFDRQSHLLVKFAMTLSSPMGEIAVESRLSDYRKDGDLLTPHRLEQSAMGQQFVITIDTVKWNEEIPDNRFDLPADVAALLPKAATK
jgi:zinc protease